MKSNYEIVVVGGGPAGLAAAEAAWESGCRDVLIIEREPVLGGILNQCIHNGFGLHTFNEELTGPEYSARFEDKVRKLGIPCITDTTVADITPNKDGTKTVICTGRETGLAAIQAKAVILAMGCRERSRGSLNIPGFRPAGIFSAGTAQRLVNIDGYMPGKKVVILGSGDIGLIMARRLTLEGAEVKLVAEIMPYSGGLKRNIVQCLDDYGIPLKLSHTVTEIRGKERVTGVTISQVDENRRPIPGTEEFYECDTLLLSVGLIPENELSRSLGVDISGVTSGPVVDNSLETSVEGVFACGNVLHVHDLVDYVTEEAHQAGRNAADYVLSGRKHGIRIPVKAEKGVRYTVPSFIEPENAGEETVIRFRTGDVYKGKYISLYAGDKRIIHRKKQILVPGEMETLKVKKADLQGDISEIRVLLEDN